VAHGWPISASDASFLTTRTGFNVLLSPPAVGGTASAYQPGNASWLFNDHSPVACHGGHRITKQRMRIEKMRFLFGKCLVIGALSMMAMGCEPEPVVVNPDDDDAVIVEEEDDTVVVPDTSATPPADNDGVNVDVGPGGVDVDVNRDAPSDANQNPNP
jgi:hypothetical protein